MIVAGDRSIDRNGKRGLDFRDIYKLEQDRARTGFVDWLDVEDKSG